jgi:hypothetical protein
VLAVVEIGGAIGIFLQYHHGVLRAAMQRLAIVALISMGGIFYVRQILTGMTMGNSPGAADPAVLAALPSYTVLRQVDAGNCLALGLVGVVLMFLPRRDAV